MREKAMAVLEATRRQLTAQVRQAFTAVVNGQSQIQVLADGAGQQGGSQFQQGGLPHRHAPEHRCAQRRAAAVRRGARSAQGPRRYPRVENAATADAQT